MNILGVVSSLKASFGLAKYHSQELTNTKAVTVLSLVSVSSLSYANVFFRDVRIYTVKRSKPQFYCHKTFALF